MQNYNQEWTIISGLDFVRKNLYVPNLKNISITDEYIKLLSSEKS